VAQVKLYLTCGLVLIAEEEPQDTSASGGLYPAPQVPRVRPKWLEASGKFGKKFCHLRQVHFITYLNGFVDKIYLVRQIKKS